ncbi:sce7726 family protein [Pedobacter gandavensis]|uniref:sce7726 family protein n=1 Tax=Pedobacter gandavensis TaxID=2679963 RepID=UPI0029310AA7|nr:sce7726 family protein [Pedobacter gandavensis]
MSLGRINSQVNLSALAKMMSNAGLQRMMFTDNFKQQAKHLKQLLKKNGVEVEKKSYVSELINSSYEHLLTHYRHEYLYKVALLNSYVLNNYSLSDTILLNEFKIGNSKADTILINGTNKVFEIKTELDSPERLYTQINDYYKGFSEVYIVIHHSEIGKYLNCVDDHVGIMTFSKHHTIDLFKPAQTYNEKLDILVMMKALRKEEYLQLVYEITGKLPEATPVRMFKACINLLSSYSVLDVQNTFLKIIKQRISLSTNDLVQDPSVPDILRLACYHYNLNQNQYISLIERLTHQI